MSVLERLKELCNAATPGPWFSRESKKGGRWPNIYYKAATGERVYLCDGETWFSWGEDSAKFVAAARMALPALIELCEAQAHKIETDKQYLYNLSALEMEDVEYIKSTDAVDAARARLGAACPK